MSDLKSKTLSWIELKPYLTSTKNTRFTLQGCILENKLGKAGFDFSGFQGDVSICLRFRKLSGNGLCWIQTSEDKSSIQILSKVSQEVKIPIQCKKFEIDRRDCLGEIEILGATIFYQNERVESELNQDWKVLLRKCSKYASVRLIDRKLFASPGGYLESEALQEIETNPEGMWSRSGSRINFTSSCEIVKLSFSATAPPAIIPQPYIHRPEVSPPPPVFTPTRTYQPKVPLPPMQIHRPTTIELPPEPVYLYDSAVQRGLAKLNLGGTKIIKHHFSNGKDLISMSRGAILQIPISILKPNQEYVFVFTIKKLSGTGKLRAGLTNNNQPPSHMELVLADSNESEKYLILNTGFTPSDSGYKLYLSTSAEDFSGEIMFSRIRISANLNLSQVKYQVEQLGHQAMVLSPTVPLNLNYSIGVSGDDPQAQTAQKHARFNSTLIFQESVNLEIRGNLLISSYSGLAWFNKIRSVLPNLCIFKNKESLANFDLVSIGCAGSLSPAKRMWVDYFEKLEQSDFDCLSSAEKIFTPSLKNQQWLQDLLPSTKVVQTGRFWPYLEPKEIKFLKDSSYVLIVNRNSHQTKKILDLWSSEFPTPVILGARGHWPDFAIPIPEYLNYHQLLWLVLQSRAVLDISSQITESHSALFHLASQAQIPVLSSNWETLGYAQGIFLPSKQPTADQITKLLQLPFQPIKLDQKYNENLYQMMSQLFA